LPRSVQKLSQHVAAFCSEAEPTRCCVGGMEVWLHTFIIWACRKAVSLALRPLYPLPAAGWVITVVSSRYAMACPLPIGSTRWMGPLQWAGNVAGTTGASKERRKRRYEGLDIDGRVTLKLIYPVGRKP
jgi:hypothetical protein